MKLKYTLTLLACAAIAMACTEEDPIGLSKQDGLEIAPSLCAFEKDGGSVTVKVTAEGAWTVASEADWLSFAPTSGSGSASVVVTAAASEVEKERSAIATFTCGTAKKILTVSQEAAGVKYGTAENPYPASKIYEYVSGLAAGATTGELYITGVISQIVEKFGTQYGNATFYITDDGAVSDKMFEVYRALYIGNKKYDNEADTNISVGDKVVVCGTCVNYNGNTPETSQNAAYVVSIEAGTNPVFEADKEQITVAASDTKATFSITAKNLSGGWSVTAEPGSEWITSYTASGEGDGTIEVVFPANTVAEDRTAVFDVTAPGMETIYLSLTQLAYQANGTAEKPYTVAEALAVIDALEAGAKTPAEVYVKGIVASVTEVSTQYGNATYAISADGKAENAITVFRGKYLEAASFTSEDQIAAGDIVVVKGLLQKYVKNEVVTPQVAQGSALYRISRPISVAAALDATAALDDNATSNEIVFVKGVVVNIDSIDTGTYGNATFTISDDGTDATVFTIFRAKSFDNEKFTTADVFKAGDVVYLTGQLKKYVKNEVTTPELVNGYLVAVAAAALAE